MVAVRPWIVSTREPVAVHPKSSFQYGYGTPSTLRSSVPSKLWPGAGPVAGWRVKAEACDRVGPLAPDPTITASATATAATAVVSAPARPKRLARRCLGAERSRSASTRSRSAIGARSSRPPMAVIARRCSASSALNSGDSATRSSSSRARSASSVPSARRARSCSMSL